MKLQVMLFGSQNDKGLVETWKSLRKQRASKYGYLNEEVENNVPTGRIRQSVHKINPSFKGTCSDVRKRKEFKWKYKHTKLPELVEEPEIVQ